MSKKKAKSFTLSPKVIKAIEKEAERQDRSISKVVDMILAEKFQAKKETKTGSSFGLLRMTMTV